MSIINKSLTLLLALSLTGCDNQFADFLLPDIEPEVCDTDTTTVTFKKVGYWSSDEGDDEDDIDLIDFSKLTHVIYTSISVESDGDIVALSDDDEDLLEYLVEQADDAGIEVGVAIGTGSDSNFNTIAESSTYTKNFVSEVDDFIAKYELTGVELNWTAIGDDDESENLEELLDELEESLSTDGYFLAMALPSGEYDSADNIENDMFTYIDFANVHAFDSTDSDDLHSSLDDATDAISYWTDRCLIQNKLVLGVPFYSRDDDNTLSRSYDEILDDDTENACEDEDSGDNYNGIPTMTDKTTYAMLYAGGIMMNALEQDTYDYPSYSLLKAVDDISDGSEVTICD